MAVQPTGTESAPAFSWSRVGFALAGVGALGFVLHLISRSSAPTEPPKTIPKDDFLAHQHQSGFRSFNELTPLPFTGFAEGFIQFHLQEFTPEDEFYIHCMEEGQKHFYEHVASPQEMIEFFLPNFPYQKAVVVNFFTTAPTGERKTSGFIRLTIEHKRGRYQIIQKEGSFSSNSEALPDPEVKHPISLNRHTPLIKPLSIMLKSNGNFNTYDSEERENNILYITNPHKALSVVYLKLKNPNSEFLEQSVSIPFVIPSGQSLGLSRRLIKSAWKTAYQWSIGKVAPEGNLALHFAGLQQFIY